MVNDTKHMTSMLLKTIRKNLGLSQEELARELGVSFATVNRWENGKTNPSNLAKMQLNKLHKKAKKRDNSAKTSN